MKKNPVTFNQLIHVTATQRSAQKTWFTEERYQNDLEHLLETNHQYMGRKEIEHSTQK